MNERIRDLANQADLFHILPNDNLYPTTMTAEQSIAAYQKFAELILEECVAFANKEADHLEDEFERGRADDLRRWGHVMKQHFGFGIYSGDKS